jgi:hypothetical protein
MKNLALLAGVCLTLALAACGGEEDSADSGADNQYPSELVAEFMAGCESSAIESSGGLLTEEQARSYCRCGIDEIQKSLPIDEFEAWNTDPDAADPPEVSRAIEKCMSASDEDGRVELDTVTLPTAPNDPSAQTFHGEGYSFSYPMNWGQGEAEFAQDPEEEPGTIVNFSPGTETEILTVATFVVPRPVTEDNLDEVAAQSLVPLITQLYERILEGPSTTTVGGLPALYVVAKGLNQDGDKIVSRSAFVFDGSTEYALECQYAPLEEDEMRPGCEQVFATFQVD